jgi:hypothetical protein
VIEFMSRCGANVAEIQQSFDDAIHKHVARQTGTISSDHVLYVRNQNLPAQLLRLWHRNERYLDAEARPRELSFARGSTNLKNAISQIDSSADARSVLESMQTAGLLKRTARGNYLPTGESAIVDQVHPLLVEHVTKLISRLVSTVSRNIDPTGQALKLIDRHAYTAELSPSERQAFADFTRSHGMAYLQSIDDWLERKRISRSSARRSASKKSLNGVDAGVYLFAYLGDEEATLARPNTRPKPTRKESNSSTPA